MLKFILILCSCGALRPQFPINNSVAPKVATFHCSQIQNSAFPKKKILFVFLYVYIYIYIEIKLICLI